MITQNLKLSVGLLVALLFTISACGNQSTPVKPNGNEIETVVAATLQSLTEQAPPAGSDGIAVTAQNVSFVIPNGLATGSTFEVVPANTEEEGGPWGVAPEHIKITLTGYPLVEQYFEPVVHVYPAKEYAEVNPWAESSLGKLQALLASPSMPLINDNLPTIPFDGAAAQLYAAQAKLLPFNGGNGVRMISKYGQFPAPVTKDGSFYHYEGLTSDGKYFVAARFLVTLPLQSTGENPSADGINYPADLSSTAEVDAYYNGITDKLNAAITDVFQPNLELLDALIQSVTVTSQ